MPHDPLDRVIQLAADRGVSYSDFLNLAKARSSERILVDVLTCLASDPNRARVAVTGVRLPPKRRSAVDRLLGGGRR
jgi:hypothetical protein